MIYNYFRQKSRPENGLAEKRKETIFMTNASFTVTEDTCLSDWMRFWFKTYKTPNIKNTTYDDYNSSIERHIIPAIGSTRLSEINSFILQDFFNRESESGNITTGGALSPKSVHNMRNVLNAALNKAAIMEYIPKNPMIAVEIQPLEKKEMTVLTVEEEQRLIGHLIRNNFSGKYDFAIFLALTLGLRNGEICALKFGSFDFSEMIVKIRSRVTRVNNRNITSDTDPKTYLESASPKTKESMRDIPFNDKFAETVKNYFKTLAPRSYSKDNYILISKNGNPASNSSVNHYFQAKLRELGIKKKMTFHDLRHTFATRAIENNVDIKALSVILGHASVQFTLDRYAHVLSDHKRSTMDTLLSNVLSDS